MNWKIWAPIGIVAIVALIMIQLGTRNPQAPVVGETPGTPDIAQELPVAATESATGNVDAATDAILSGIADDEAIFVDATKDAELVVVDNQAIDNLGQSYYENEF
ncbi:MAG: hypothetical protein COZ49_03905 [Candidatus Yonathbacteria bacterium CG_4_10_14_3_um_filter_47_65]|uniref:Uncharacterized protein n=2 Tax=Parcubacteria group TaxID=1794811 RepID=A0A2M8D7K0_9BACT|nr:MAG: hypothetical protein AUJ44_00275 [Candidatus Nomurabacteria bacterium CG1_02_47_685]PIP03877.1 MAG: hypothetical protein COX54_02000 [Candidatus Yonathbacteria bacterium CG23_combo_of_CG06-09_8_20_14_all_46_18]PIQ32812.1 MAG: hypothetical protein COW61_00815 [Candidatus Yonathbacteria bacterium CG17_big_fil_post_rev_8_21_14_2_50_46_19]PIX56082.1 MAG: hypothetical protein COZ49_03905 [Candidatus Yonathbacteria bacterium CG_4_10_14_3_um_filter_47_65]PIY57805.1 MAG: hypothetical protein CO